MFHKPCTCHDQPMHGGVAALLHMMLLGVHTHTQVFVQSFAWCIASARIPTLPQCGRVVVPVHLKIRKKRILAVKPPICIPSAIRQAQNGTGQLLQFGAYETQLPSHI